MRRRSCLTDYREDIREDGVVSLTTKKTDRRRRRCLIDYREDTREDGVISLTTGGVASLQEIAVDEGGVVVTALTARGVRLGRAPFVECFFCEKQKERKSQLQA